MSLLLDVNVVQYTCSCGEESPLCSLYFCRHCLTLRCNSCVTHEVDSIYCPTCLENLPSAEARLKKNRCGSCFECPSCDHSLSTRATTAFAGGARESGPDSGTDSSAGPQKVFYMACNFCRWTSRDVGLPDQKVASGSWPEKENPCANLILEIQENYRVLASEEKMERERKRFGKRRTYMAPLNDKYGIGALKANKRLGLPLDAIVSKETMASEPLQSPESASLQATDEVPSLPESVFTAAPALPSITTIEERLRVLDTQPTARKELFPKHRQLIIKCSQRCKKCDHNLCKAEYTPQTIKFKILLCAIYHVPEVRLMRKPDLRPGEKCSVLLTLANLTTSKTHVMILPDFERLGPNIVEADVPTSELVLDLKDDSLDYDDASVKPNPLFKDDPKVVISRRGHKIGIQMGMTPPADAKGDLYLHLVLKYDYMNTLLHITGEAKNPELVWMQQKVCINLGPYSDDV